MSKSCISLTVDSGPKKGATLDRKPGSIIRIGRVVKGNTLTIKDPSVSQKHLAIEFDPVVSRWVLRDIATSNNIFVNGSLLFSCDDSPVPLSDGDVINIGDSTSISVRVLPIEMGNDGRRMRNRTTVEKKVEILEPDLDERVEVPKNSGRNSSDAKGNKYEVVEDGRMKVLENLGRGRRGRSAAVSGKDENFEPGLDQKIQLLVNTARNCADVKENRDESMVDKRMKVLENMGRGRTSRTRVSKKEDILDPGHKDERIEVLSNSGRNSSDVKESKGQAVEDGSKVPEILGRGRRGKSATVSKKDGVVQDDIINATNNLRRGRRTVSIQILEKDPSMDLIVEDGGGNSSSVLVENEILEPLVECCIEVPNNLGRRRRNSKKDVVLEDTNEVPKATERGRRTVSIEDSEGGDILNLVIADKNSVPKNDNYEPFVEASKNLGRGRRNSQKDAVLEDKNEVLKTIGRWRGRRTRSTKLSDGDGILNSVAEDKISVPKNTGRGGKSRVSKFDETFDSIEDEGGTEVKKKLGRGKQRANSSKASKTDEMFDDAVVKEKPRRVDNSSKVLKTYETFNVVSVDAVIKQKPRMAYSSKVSKTDEMFDVVVEDAVFKQKPIRADSSKVSKTDGMFDIAEEDAVVNEKPRRAAARRTRASSKVSKDEQLFKPLLDLKNPVLNPVENSYQLKELREDFHRVSKQDKIQQISLISSSAADSKDKRTENKEGNGNCVSIECQKTEDEIVGTQIHKSSRVVPKVWNGNGIPNTTTKYQEDQKISWHGTPFEERVERALSDDKLLPQRNLTN